MRYERNLSELQKVKKNGYKVFSTFSCGGGSTMGYKNAGYEVIGNCDIDDQMINVYKLNHNPKYTFKMGVGDFNNLPDEEIPKELFDIDILDGSPPCSTFSTAGLRERARGKEKMFREGQAKQVLDDLFFQFLDTVGKLRPKIVIAENVSGMLKGNAKGYVKMIVNRFVELGYSVQVFLLNGASMGLPQKRERVFFIARRNDLKLPNIVFNFKEAPIVFGDIEEINPKEGTYKKLTKAYGKLRDICLPGYSLSSVHYKGSFFNQIKAAKNKVLNTITAASSTKIFHYNIKRCLSIKEFALASSFPLDYNYGTIKDPVYLMGMSVPPLMMYKISKEVEKQLLNKL